MDTITRLSEPQQRAIIGADPDTDRIGHGRANTLAALERRGLIQRHTATGLPYLTSEGRRVHARLLNVNYVPGRVIGGVLDSLQFQVNDGCQEITRLAPPAQRGPEVSRAWIAVLGQRRDLLLGCDDRPAPWEAQAPVRAVSLALEAAGEQPAATDRYGRWERAGYCVERGDRDDAARVSYKPRHVWEQVGHRERRDSRVLYSCHLQALMSFEASLEVRGWKAERHHASPTGRPYLIISPTVD
ncbi:hypothetical protein ABZS76_32945 [Streptomyces sp. NPDC005562]|uniref:hypothetical protein n=1 Tax=Streptomyces sp. NPDC005562 TaxID=3154890 RepID=UPI0033BF1EFD